MKIVFLVRRFYPLIGGVETHVMEIAKLLVANGDNVVIVTENFPDQNLKGEYLQHEIHEGMDIFRISGSKEGRFKKFAIWGKLYNIRKIFSDADIVHCHDVFFWYLPFRFIYPNKKVFTTFHGHETKFPPSKKAITIRKLSEKLSRGSIIIGEYIKKWYYAKPDYVLYGGINVINVLKHKRNENSKKLKLVFVGRLENDLGIVTYLKLLELLKKVKISFQLDVYGVGSFKERLKKYGRVHGFVNNVESYLKNADIVFASSYLSIIQALALKKTVIAVYENPLKEDYLRMSPFANFIFICKNSNEIVEVIKYIKDNPWKSKSMIENGYNWAIKHTWNEIFKTYLDLWKK